MIAAAILPIALPGTGAKRPASAAAALLERLRFMDGSVRELPEAEETTS